MKCPNCKKEIDHRLKICDQCGSHIEYLVQLSTIEEFLEFERKQNLEYLKYDLDCDKTISNEITDVIIDDSPTESPINHQQAKKRKFLPLVFSAAVLLLCIVGAISIVAIFHYNFNLSRPSASVYFESFGDEMVASGPDHVEYVKGRLLLTAKKNTPYKEINKLVEDQGGKIIGYIKMSNDYQIQYGEDTSYNELLDICNHLSQNDKISKVTFEEVFDLQYDSFNYGTDPWDNAIRWNPVYPDEINWWAEALGMQNVWESKNTFEEVKVGIIDGFFDDSHDDLKDAFAPKGIQGDMDLNLEEKFEESKDLAYMHGTHVAGIIGARNNNSGICGVNQNASLYGYSIGKRFGEKISIMACKCAIASLLEKEVKIINISLGSKTWYDSIKAEHKDMAYSLQEFLLRCIKKYDFLIVKSAGNQEAGNEEEDVSYDLFGAIEDEEVRKHIIMVGAYDIDHTTNQNTIRISKDSPKGSFIDVYAPAGSLILNNNEDIKIASDLPGNQIGFYNGTSQAAPMVAGIASLIWGSDDSLTAMKVKNILLNSSINAKIEDQSDIRIANAYAAVLSVNKEESKSLLLGYTYLKKQNGEMLNAYSTVDVYNKVTKEKINSSKTDKCGFFAFFLDPGEYVIDAQYDIDESVKTTIKIVEDKITYCPVWANESNKTIN